MPPFDMSLVQRGARLRRSPFFETEQRHVPLAVLAEARFVPDPAGS